MPPRPEDRFFFIHIMKTAGTTFFHHCLASTFTQAEIYPNRQIDPVSDLGESAYWRLDHLFALPPARRAAIRVYAGHFPFFASQLVDCGLVTITVLRDPVSRTASYLKHCKENHPQHHALSLEEIYEDRFFFSRFIENHQTKIFAMTTDNADAAFMDAMVMDEQDLDVAKANLEKVDVLALHESFEDLPGELERRFGWSCRKLGRQRAGQPHSVSADLERRIASDNAIDMEFYEFARNLHREKRKL